MRFGRAGSGVRARLPIKLLLAILPLAVAGVILCYFVCSRELISIEQARSNTTFNFGRSVGDILRRAAVDARWELSVARERASDKCAGVDDFHAAERRPDFSVAVLLPTGETCFSGSDRRLDRTALVSLADLLRGTATRFDAADATARYNYGLTNGPTGSLIAVFVQLSGDGPNAAELSAVALVSPDRVWSLLSNTSNFGVANDTLISDGNALVRLHSAPESAARAVSFVTAPVGSSGLNVELAFGSGPIDDVHRRFYLGCLGFLILAALIWLAIVRLARIEEESWLRGLEGAMPRRSRATGMYEIGRASSVARPEFREIVSVFEEWAVMADRRELDLLSSLDANQKLIRELHHRVKNSLQVIQSYLALSRREDELNDMRAVLHAEARVRVLSIAYRLALTEHGMEPVRVKPFIAELVSATAAAMRRPGQHVSTELSCDAELNVDRAIPLGLGVVEALIAAMRARDAARVDVVMWEARPGVAAISVRSDVGLSIQRPSARIMAGLAEQLRAHVIAEDAREVLEWEFAFS
jgi:two-component sensor histidine kinase